MRSQRRALLGPLLALAVLVLPLAVPAAPAQAQIAFSADLGANEANSTGASSRSITTLNAAPAGASIFVMAVSDTLVSAGSSPPVAATCADGTNTYSTDRTASTSFTLTSICSTHRIAGPLNAGSTITVSWSLGIGPFSQRVRAFAVTGLATTPLDRTAAGKGTGSSPSSGTTTQTQFANELLVGAIADVGFSVSNAGFSAGTNGTANNCTNTGSPTYAALTGVGSINPVSLFGMYCIVAAQAQYAAQASIAGNPQWEALLATYIGASPTPTNTPTSTATATATPTPTVTPTPVRLPGDFNGDGFVDIRDYGVWRQNFGQTNCGNPADADGNCLVDIRDYGIWRQHFGEGTPADRRQGAALPAGISPAPRGTPGPILLRSEQAVAGSWAPHEPNGSDATVPIVPLVGGLLGLGGLAGWRRRRHPRGE